MGQELETARSREQGVQAELSTQHETMRKLQASELSMLQASEQELQQLRRESDATQGLRVSALADSTLQSLLLTYNELELSQAGFGLCQMQTESFKKAAIEAK